MAININTLNAGNMTLGSSGSTPAIDPAKTRFTLQDGTVEEYDIQGEWTDSINAELGLQEQSEWCWTKKIVRIDVGTHVTSMGDFCLWDNSSGKRPNDMYNLNDLTVVNIPDTVTSIGKQVFQGNGLRSIVIPSSVTHISEDAFMESSLTSIIFQGKTIEQVQAMDNYNNWGIDTSIISVA